MMSNLTRDVCCYRMTDAHGVSRNTFCSRVNAEVNAVLLLFVGYYNFVLLSQGLGLDSIISGMPIFPLKNTCSSARQEPDLLSHSIAPTIIILT
jgi:hypothetical protein